MKCLNNCQQCQQGNTLERNISIDDLKVGDIVSPEGKYITSEGFYYSMGTGFRIRRINTKSISLVLLKWNGVEFVDDKILRINKKVIEHGYLTQREVEPVFARDNSRLRPAK